MKRIFTLAPLGAAVSADAFQLFAVVPKSTTTDLSAVSKDCRQGDMSAECLLSDQELGWFYLHKGEDRLALELVGAKARIKRLEADLSAVNSQHEEEEKEAGLEVVQDPNDIERRSLELDGQWGKGKCELFWSKLLSACKLRRQRQGGLVNEGVSVKERMEQTKQRINTIASSAGASALATLGAKIGSRMDIQLASVGAGIPITAASVAFVTKIQSILSRIHVLPTCVTIGTAIGASIGAVVGIKVADIVLSRLMAVRPSYPRQ